ncbi:MAG TPA: YicC/YloC family endoribonuclease [Pyrinomonadaceae bacterium]|nr:YicC/YloC family endoribonuclease [Pyrinomonadaceae bacterium]
MKSMTGFGRGNFTGEAFNVAVEIKTVNNRFLDIHLRMSQELAPLEMNLRKLISSRLSRGRVDVSINLERTGSANYEINRNLIAGYVKALRDIQQEFDLAGDVDINTLTRLPGAMGQARSGMDESMTDGILRSISEALDELEKMRGVEGATLAEEMRVRLAKIESEVPVIEDAAAGIIETYRQRVQKRVNELLGNGEKQGIELDAGRLAQEIAYLADRSDVTEELARLRSHLEQFRVTIDNPGEVGKRLDFLLQELNREANTVLSKSTEIAIKDAGLAIKAEVEKLREQVQNVE